MRLVSSYAEAVEVVVCVLGLLGLRLHVSCNELHCFRRELFPTGYCREHQRPAQHEKEA